MTASRINNYSPSTSVLDSVITSVDYGLVGAMALSLTNYTSTIRPSVASGSIVDIAGNLFEFSTENSISTTGIISTAACDYYIKLVPSSSECSVQFSTVVPTWRTDYQGYYENSTSINRFIGEMYFTGSDYVDKRLYYGANIMKTDIVFGLLVSTNSATSTAGITYTVPMDNYIKQVTSIRVLGALNNFPGSVYLSSYQVASTSVSVVLTGAFTIANSSEFSNILVNGVNY